jgi:predicted nucleic acid-binding protein
MRRRHLAAAARVAASTDSDVLLADTSVWISHLHRGDAWLTAALDEGRVLIHPFVMGELACGRLRERVAFLRDLGQLPVATSASHDEVLHVVERHQLAGTGIGWIDAHLLTAARLSEAELYTHDAALRAAWARLR